MLLQSPPTIFDEHLTFISLSVDGAFHVLAAFVMSDMSTSNYGVLVMTSAGRHKGRPRPLVGR